MSHVAVWYKYPNPHTEHVQSIDVLDRTICPQTGTVRTERLISVEQHTPRWIKRILGVDGATYVREVITFDPNEPAVYMDSTKYVSRAPTDAACPLATICWSRKTWPIAHTRTTRRASTSPPSLTAAG